MEGMRSQEAVMVKQEIIFDIPVPKKHSIRYDTSDPKACVQSIYIKREVFGTPVPPTAIKMTLEEVKP